MHTKKHHKKHHKKHTKTHHKKHTKKHPSQHTNINLNARGIIIPHAGKQYAGHARYSAFKYVNPNIKYIIYIATIHKQNNSNKTYILHNDNFIDKSILAQNNLGLEYKHTDEHSFKWVHDELIKNFPHSKILAIGPNNYTRDLVNFIYDFLSHNPDSVLISTSDLIHYGPRYNNVGLLNAPQQLDKIHKEENLISDLVSHNMNIHTIKKHANIGHLMCGPRAVELFSEIMIKMKLTGKVVDYYDSHSTSKDILNKYLISTANTENFVSYVSIIYGENVRQNTIIDFDVMMQIAILKSTIKNHLMNYPQDPLYTPKWSPFHKSHQGVFVGTSIENKTNCSTGVFENTRDDLTYKKIIKASKNCIRDAIDRWNVPHTRNKLDKMNYKIELLEPKNQWKHYPAHNAQHVFDLKSGKYGIVLTLPGGQSATYLPVVAQENPHWTINQYMESLAKKALGNPENFEWKNWKKGKIEVYKTTSYTWNTKKQQLIIT